jgi:hypothetical protein
MKPITQTYYMDNVTYIRMLNETPCFADLEPRSVLLMTSMYILQRYDTSFFFLTKPIGMEKFYLIGLYRQNFGMKYGFL